MATTPAEEAKIMSSGILPVGVAGSATPASYQTYDRRFALSAAVAPTSGTLTLTGIWLPAGTVVTGITFVSGATGESGGSHLFYALYKADLTLMAQATDNTGATAFAANTAFRMALTAAQTCPYSGLYYLGFMCVGTIPTLLNITGGVANANGSITGMTPITSATSSTGLTTTAPNPAGALTTVANSYYAFVD